MQLNYQNVLRSVECSGQKLFKRTSMTLKNPKNSGLQGLLFCLNLTHWMMIKNNSEEMAIVWLK